MKHIMLLLMALMLLPRAHACDACGANMSSDSWGLMPGFNRNSAGFRFQYRYYHNRHVDMRNNDMYLTEADDHFYKTDAFLRWSLHRRLQVTATMPFRYNDRYDDTGHIRESGAGDASLLFTYSPILPGCNAWKHALMFNAGVEGPTGKFRFSHDIPVNMQTGSGTWDFIAGLAYSIRYKKAGMSFEGTQRFNGHTSEGYDWGNATMFNTRIFLTLSNDSNSTWMPWIGCSGEHYQPNIENMTYQIRAAYTGGNLMMMNAGIDFYGKYSGWSVECGIPVINDLADGMTQMRLGAGMRWMYFIGSKKQERHKTKLK